MIGILGLCEEGTIKPMVADRRQELLLVLMAAPGIDLASCPEGSSGATIPDD